jgi:hypothetical protein
MGRGAVIEHEKDIAIVAIIVQLCNELFRLILISISIIMHKN